MADTATVTTIETAVAAEVQEVTELELHLSAAGRVTRWSLALVVPVVLVRKVSMVHKVEHRRCSLLVPQEEAVADTTKVVADKLAAQEVAVLRLLFPQALAQEAVLRGKEIVVV